MCAGGLFMSSVVTLRGVSFELTNGRVLFDHLNVSLEDGLTALVGPNGIGKTCLARILAGDLNPSVGKVLRSCPVVYFPQRQIPEPITVDEFLGFDYSRDGFREKLVGNIDRDALCTSLSGGEWIRIRLAQAVAGGFLILDEPTNDLDREGRELVAQFLRKRKGGALLISHDRECLELCSSVLELSNRGLSKYGGGWQTYLETKEQERNALSHALDCAKRERDKAVVERHEQRVRQEKRNRQGARNAARGGIPRILLGSLQNSAEATLGRVNTETLDSLNDAVRNVHEALSQVKVDPVMYVDLIGAEIPAQKLVAEASGFNVHFKDWIYQQDLEFSWRGNVRIALNGRNGSGKSTLLRAILGEKFQTRGSLRTGNLTTLYIDQRCEFLDDKQSVLENVQDKCHLSEMEARNGLARFLFPGEKVFQKVGELSGGERLRAALARGFLSPAKPELLMLDEPTNNLDLTNIEFLEKLVCGFHGAIIVVSHDKTFLQNCSINAELAL